jgi:hypothetical protein
MTDVDGLVEEDGTEEKAGRDEEVERLQKEVATLRRALESRTVIGYAVGLVMSSAGMSSTEAFDELRRISNRTHQKVRDVAEKMVRRHDDEKRRAQELADSPTAVLGDRPLEGSA